MLSKTICFLILLVSTLVRADVNSDQYSSLDFESIEDQAKSQKINLDESDTEYWMKNAQHYLEDIISDSKIMSMSSVARAKNVIFFLGDGMSLATVAAARMYLGGEEKSLSFEKFRHFGLSKTYCVDKQVADSACSSTAYLSGVKANFGTMGLTAKIPLNSCTGQNSADEQTVSIAGWAQKQCKSTGLVTNAKLTDASPGGLFAHIANRYWENDIEVKKSGCDPLQTIDIARQFVENDVPKRLKIVLACGREEFRDQSVFDEESIPGKRGDRRDLIDEWLVMHEKEGKSKFIHDKKGLQNISNDEYILGLFGVDHCPYNIDIETNAKMRDVKPMLSEMTHSAIKHLQKNNENGYFLFIESARIDMAHHENWARVALDETKEFSRAIEIARNITDEKDTLIVVTSDHAHTMSYNGYSSRGSDILGLSGSTAADGLPYTTLSYANGPGYHQTYDATNGSRVDLSKYNLSDPRHRFPATVPLISETHGGEDVGIYAHGPQSHLFVGNYEQSYIPIVIAHIAKIGPFAENDQCFKSSAFIPIPALFLLPALLGLQYIRILLIH